MIAQRGLATLTKTTKGNTEGDRLARIRKRVITGYKHWLEENDNKLLSIDTAGEFMTMAHKS